MVGSASPRRLIGSSRAGRYASKPEKGSRAFDQLVADAVNKKDYEHGDTALRAFTSFLVQQTGSRNWSSQEVGHVLMGHPSNLQSHSVIRASVGDLLTVKELQGDEEDSEPATIKGDWAKYLDRMSSVPKYGSMDNHVLRDGVVPETGMMDSLSNDVKDRSFMEFYRKYRFASAGAGKKGKHSVVQREESVILNLKPHTSKSWFAPDHPRREEYCRNMLRAFKPFESREAYNTYIRQHNENLTKSHYRAYLHFAHDEDADAPQCVKDDFRKLACEDDGEEIDNPSSQPIEDLTFSAFRKQRDSFKKVDSAMKGSTYDWVSNSQERYSDDEIKGASGWIAAAHNRSGGHDEVVVDADSLRPAQRFVFDAVMDHRSANSASRLVGESGLSVGASVPPLLALVNGTAGSGKTWLIRAIKTALGAECLVLAPTGVAADNIGGTTYHTVIPVPTRGTLDRDEILPSEMRTKRIVTELTGVRYIIIDEMSMLGRRSLGQIDHILRHALKRTDEPFGGLSIILVGDHGQLPPVKDCRCFDTKDVRYGASSKQRGQALPGASKWQRKGIEAYELIVSRGRVFFLDEIQRVQQVGEHHADAVSVIRAVPL